MSLSQVLNSDAALTLLATLLGGAWTLFQSSKWYECAKNRRYHKAIQALKAAVDHTYRSYVQAIKEARADGKLTEDERRRAREMARQAAVFYGRRQGVDVLAELGDEYMDLWIAKLVKRLKGE